MQRSQVRNNSKFDVLSGGVPASVLGCKQQKLILAASGRKGAYWKVTGRSQSIKDGWILRLGEVAAGFRAPGSSNHDQVLTVGRAWGRSCYAG